ncbi:MAG: C-GCAxxG-C-C family protein [Desulfovibrio sp.]
MTKKQAADEAARLFGCGPLCAEAVLGCVAQEKGVVSPLIPRIATGFCSGLGRTGGPCGALMGAVLGVNLCTGRCDPARTDESLTELGENYGRVREVVEGFLRRFGATDCTTLCGCDLTNGEGRERYKETDAYERCREFIRESVLLALTALEE